MNTHLPLITRRFLASKFSILRIRALSDLFQAMQTGSNSTPEVFPGRSQRLSPRLKWIGLENIRVTEIVGTFEPQTVFDDQFRPLQKHARDRWISACFQMLKNGRIPLRVHKVGSQYFVDDGVYCVSVARFLGMEFITAEVWEYEIEEAEPCPYWPCHEKDVVEPYVAW